MTETALMNLWAWSLQTGLITAAAAVVARTAQIDLPAARYAWWRAVLLACLALPLIQPWQPPRLPSTEIVGLDVAEAAPAEALTAGDGTTSGTMAPRATRFSWEWILAAGVAGGAVLRLGWLAAGLIRLRRVRRTGIAATTSDASELLRCLIDAGADVRYVDSLRQPVTFGIRAPVVLLPGVLRTLPPGVQQAVLTHELWHVRRRDWLWSFSEEVLRSIFWFHPAIWYLVSQVQGAREEVVDRLSVLSTNARRSYLEALLTFAEEPALHGAAPFIRRRQLFNRMLLISKEGVMSPKRIVAWSGGMAGALVVAGWYSMLTFPLTATEAVRVPAERRGQPAQAQPRDPRPGIPRPETAREQELKTSTATDPSNVKHWLELATLQEGRGAVAEAEATLSAAFTATSGNREVLLAQARFFTRQGNFDRAVERLETAAAQDPTDPAGHQLVATYYWEKAQKDTLLTPADKLRYIDAGIRASDRALAQRSDYVDALVYKSILLRFRANLETDTAAREQLLAQANLLRTRALELRKQQPDAPSVRDPHAPPPPPPPPPPGSYDVDGQQAVRIGGDIPAPKKIRDVRPAYPQGAFDAGITGTVVLEAVIDAQGHVRSAGVLRSVPELDAAAIEAVKQWQFVPTVLDGAAIPVVMTVTVTFRLQ